MIALAITQLCEVIRRCYFAIPETVNQTTTQWFHDADLVLEWLIDGGLKRYIIKTCLCNERRTTGTFTLFADHPHDHRSSARNINLIDAIYTHEFQPCISIHKHISCGHNLIWIMLFHVCSTSQRRYRIIFRGSCGHKFYHHFDTY